MTAGDATFSHSASKLHRRDVDAQVEVPHQMTGVDKLRAEGYYGSGLRVAVVDSGIDYKHPALGGCYGEGCLVAFGYDLVDDVNDPYDNCNGHGII
jgi:subtilisin family serine protease